MGNHVPSGLSYAAGDSISVYLAETKVESEGWVDAEIIQKHTDLKEATFAIEVQGIDSEEVAVAASIWI